MKRLKNKLLAMDPSTTTYKSMYEGAMLVHDPAHPGMEPWMAYEPIYYRDEISYDISVTHKLAQDKPTVLVRIPLHCLGISEPSRKTERALADFCLRALIPYVDTLNAALYNRSRPDSENGKYYVYRPGGEILTTNAAFFDTCLQRDYDNGSGSNVYLRNDDTPRPPQRCLCIRMQVQLPAKKLRRAMQMLCHDLPDAIDTYIFRFDRDAYASALALAEQQAAIRAYLKGSDYCAFVANGSILPRAKGTHLPLQHAVPFHSTQEDEIEICGVRGMGIRRGVTVITGGGYSGKSTLLDAIAAGIYDHAPGDGRELCITDESAVTICAEDGRSVQHLNISPFIRWLPNGDTCDFSTDHASGSTSQAANIMEAVECGAGLLLIDEDRSATNFMIRDDKMKQLIEKEPITPFTDRVNELHRSRGVSTILVIGGSGEYLSVADRIYLMEDYLIHDVTARAEAICVAGNAQRASENSTAALERAEWGQARTLLSDHFTSYPEGSGSERLLVSEMGFVTIGDEGIDLRGLHNIVTQHQLDALGLMLRYLEISNTDRRIALETKINALYARLDREGTDVLYSPFFTAGARFLALPRHFELRAMIHRMRKIHFVKERDTQDHDTV